MGRFNSVVRHVPGKDLAIADYLSRSPLPFAADVDAHIDMVLSSRPITNRRLQWLRAATADDEDLQTVMEYCQQGWPMQTLSSLRPYE